MKSLNCIFPFYRAYFSLLYRYFLDFILLRYSTKSLNECEAWEDLSAQERVEEAIFVHLFHRKNSQKFRVHLKIPFLTPLITLLEVFMNTTIFTMLFIFVFCSKANAYFDPGTGSLVLQMLIGGIAVLSLFFNKIIRKIKGIFNHFNSGSETDDDKNENPEG